MKVQLCVATLVGLIYETEAVVRNCSIAIHDKIFPVDLVLLEIQGYDMILGMEWLSKHKATIDCERKLLALVIPKGEKLMYKRTNHKEATQSSQQPEPLRC